MCGVVALGDAKSATALVKPQARANWGPSTPNLSQNSIERLLLIGIRCSKRHRRADRDLCAGVSGHKRDVDGAGEGYLLLTYARVG